MEKSSRKPERKSLTCEAGEAGDKQGYRGHHGIIHLKNIEKPCPCWLVDAS